jgi:hypothetical protein
LALSVSNKRELRPPRTSGAGLIGGLLLSALTPLAVWLGGSLSDQAGGSLLRDIGWSGALGALLFFALWLRAWTTPNAPLVIWLTVAVGPALEAAWAARNPSARARDFGALLDTARAVLPESRPLRVLSVPASRGNVDTLVGNSGLFHAGVQAINGLSPWVDPDVAEILDLSAHGQPDAHADLAWSSLPSLFGVTHLVLPAIECGSPALRLAPASAARVTPKRRARPRNSSARPSSRVRATARDWKTEVRAPSKATPGIALGFYDNNLSPPQAKVFELFVPGNSLSKEFAASPRR